jgi:hypothetical protein
LLYSPMKCSGYLASDRCREKWWDDIVVCLHSLSSHSTENDKKSIRNVYRAVCLHDIKRMWYRHACSDSEMLFHYEFSNEQHCPSRHESNWLGQTAYEIEWDIQKTASDELLGEKRNKSNLFYKEKCMLKLLFNVDAAGIKALVSGNNLYIPV